MLRRDYKRDAIKRIIGFVEDNSGRRMMRGGIKAEGKGGTNVGNSLYVEFFAHTFSEALSKSKLNIDSTLG